MILDTSFLIDVMNDELNALEKTAEIEHDGVVQRIPAMTIQELYIGVGYSGIPEQERRKIETVVESRPVVETTAPIARKAGVIDGQLRRQGEQIDAGDAVIGATSIVLDEPVITGNSNHFDRISDLEVVSY